MRYRNQYINNFLLIIFFTILFGFLSVLNLRACEIEFSIDKNKKDIYSVGDELIVRVTVALTHRNCPEGIERTKFNPEGIQILAATPWKEIAASTYERKLKMKITGNKNGKVVLKALRTCEKEGGKASLTLKAVPVK
jgi:hypothetical protein